MFDHVLEIIQNAHPLTYFILLILAGLGVPISEDLIAIWVGGSLGRGEPDVPYYWYLLALYAGIVGSDMVTFFIGRLAHDTLGGRVRRLLLRQQTQIDRAVVSIQKHGDRVGFIQRFSLGARLPITLVAGYSGMSPWRFLLGTSLGASVTLSIQLSIGYLARHQIMNVVDFLRAYGGIIGAGILVSLITVLYLRFRKTEETPVPESVEEQGQTGSISPDGSQEVEPAGAEPEDPSLPVSSTPTSFPDDTP